jgi:hypothetical protein
MSAREKPAATVELRDAPAAVRAVARYITDEPGPLAAEATRCPPDRNALADGLTVLSGGSDPVVQQKGFSAADNQH